jgi:iron complex transport system ATP-binding protein
MSGKRHPGILRAAGLQVRIGERVLCRRLDLAPKPGQCWGLLGRNGAGKTTLLHTLAGMRPPGGGQVLLGGTDIASLPRRRIARDLGLLLQDHEHRFPASVLETVLSGRYPHLGPWRWPDEQDRRRALTALEQVGLADLAGRNVQALSGGERQRVAIATLLTQEPRVLLLDEPVSHLDLREQTRVLTLVRSLADRGHTVIMSLHDINHALGYCDHLLLLHRGRTLCGPTRRIGTARLLSRLFGQPLGVLQGPRGVVMVPK